VSSVGPCDNGTLNALRKEHVTTTSNNDIWSHTTLHGSFALVDYSKASMVIPAVGAATLRFSRVRPRKYERAP
jgi:hypothetical protein